MRIRKKIIFRWSVASASGSETFRLRSVCLCCSPVWGHPWRKWGDHCAGEGSQQFVASWVHRHVVSLLAPTQPREALPPCQTFLGLEKKELFWRKKPSGRCTPDLLAVCKMRTCWGAFSLVRCCRLRWAKLAVRLNLRLGVSRLCDAACQPRWDGKDTRPARLH